MANPKSLPDPSNSLLNLKFWTSLIKELGTLAFIVLFVAMIFLYYGTPSQKELFIDEFFLFRDVNKNPFPFAFVVLSLILIILFQHTYAKKTQKALREENTRIAEEKSELQKALLKKLPAAKKQES